MVGHSVTSETGVADRKGVTLTYTPRWVMARGNSFLPDTDLNSACAKGSKGGMQKAPSQTMGRAHFGVLRALGGCNLRSAF